MNIEGLNIEDLCKELEKSTRQDKGRFFEQWCREYFKTKYTNDNAVKKVYLWGDFPYRPHRDLGIDIVVELEINNTTKYIAVQCKYKTDSTLRNDDIVGLTSSLNKFLDIDGNKKTFYKGIVITTADKISENVSSSIKSENNFIQIEIIKKNRLIESGFKNLKPSSKTNNFTKSLHPYQREAIDKIKEGFKTSDRGKLIMACGTGKTYIAINLVQELNAKRVLYLVPTLALVQQTIKSFLKDGKYKQNVLIVCSDKKINEKIEQEDRIFVSEDDLFKNTNRKPTTEPSKIKDFLSENIKEKEVVNIVFCTYQSLDKIKDCYDEYKENIKSFDLVLCDEAHNTAGVKETKENRTSNFRLIQDKSNIPYEKVLFMTATPKVYGVKATKEAKDKDVELYSMDNKTIYGEEFFRYDFHTAIEENFLTDYKVLILQVISESYRKDKANIYYTTEFSYEEGDTEQDIKRKEVYHELYFNELKDRNLKRTLAFSSQIKESKSFRNTVTETKALYNHLNKIIECKHIDGGMRGDLREEYLDWLREDGNYKILSNVRCLTEGIDIPNINSIVFLRPRKSKIDIVQAVGRAIRKDDNKKEGYIVIPIIIPRYTKGSENEIVANSIYQAVYEVLVALRSHDEKLGLEIDKLHFSSEGDSKIEIKTVEVGENGEVKEHTLDNQDGTTENLNIKDILKATQNLPFADEDLRMKILENVGFSRKDFFNKWTGNIVDLSRKVSSKIEEEHKHNNKFTTAFTKFKENLQENVKTNIDEKTIKNMLVQHLITEPIFNSLFNKKGTLDNMPLYIGIENVLKELDKEQIRADLRDFYKSVEEYAKNIKKFSDKQEFLNEIYNKFFKKVDKQLANDDGIFYTPQPLVKFMIKMSNDIFQKEFNKNLGSKDIETLDCFVGTGNFIVNLLEYYKDTLKINNKDLEHIYSFNLKCNEINLLAYYISSVNIQYKYHDITGENLEYKGISLVDTFKVLNDELESSVKKQIELKNYDDNNKGLEDNRKRAEGLKKKFQFIITNPPYKKDKRGTYSSIDNEMNDLYIKYNTDSKNFNSIYDNYVRSFYFIKKRLDKDGIACIITNNQFIDKTTFSKFREDLQNSFSSVYHFDLKGNGRDLAKEDLKKQGGNVFGILTGVGITILVKNQKNQNNKEKCKIYLYRIDDYLKGEVKLSILENTKKIDSLELKEIEPINNIWINLGRQEYNGFLLLSDKINSNKNKIFNYFSKGVAVGRNAWLLGYDRDVLIRKVKILIEKYNSICKNKNLDTYKDKYGMNFKYLKPKKEVEFDENKIQEIYIQPYIKKYIYFERELAYTFYKLESIFPNNRGIVLTDKGKGDYSSYIVDKITEFHMLGRSNIFPLYFYKYNNKIENITDYALEVFKNNYKEVCKEDIFYYVYAINNSLEYKETYKNDLFRKMPRIPLFKREEDFRQAVFIGKKLANLHINYAEEKPYTNLSIRGEDKQNYDIVCKEGFQKIKYPYKKDFSKMQYNDFIYIENIPFKEFDKYKVAGGKNILDLLTSYYKVNKYDKAMGGNDFLNKECLYDNPNNFDKQKKGKYVFDLLLKSLTVGIETQTLLEQIPRIEGNFIEKIK